MDINEMVKNLARVWISRPSHCLGCRIGHFTRLCFATVVKLPVDQRFVTSGFYTLHRVCCFLNFCKVLIQQAKYAGRMYVGVGLRYEEARDAHSTVKVSTSVSPNPNRMYICGDEHP